MFNPQEYLHVGSYVIYTYSIVYTRGLKEAETYTFAFKLCNAALTVIKMHAFFKIQFFYFLY